MLKHHDSHKKTNQQDSTWPPTVEWKVAIVVVNSSSRSGSCSEKAPTHARAHPPRPYETACLRTGIRISMKLYGAVEV